MFAPDESSVDSMPATISLQSLLSNQGYNFFTFFFDIFILFIIIFIFLGYNLGNVSLVMETTLGANQWINVNDISPPEFNIILTAFEIRTFIVYLDN